MMGNNTKYNSKRDDCFKTKYILFLFKKAFFSSTIDELVNDSNIVQEFEKFTVDKELADTYSSQYYQKEINEKVQYQNIELESNIIWDKMKVQDNLNVFDLFKSEVRGKVELEYKEFYNKLKKNHNETFKETFPKETFDSLLENKECSYCGISTDQILHLGKEGKLHNKRSETRGYNLEIDRIYPNLEYTEDNCTMSCYWCNNAKTDEFLPMEFKEIAKGINSIWNIRLNETKQSNNIQIEFAHNSDIWDK